MAAAISGGNSSSSSCSSSSGSDGRSPTASFFGNSNLSTLRALASSTFLAGDEPVVILPSFSLPEPLKLTSGSFGPFRAGTDAVVPLRLATMLRRRRLARIVPPVWMDTGVLRSVLRFERDVREAS
jgi:GINS complex subunit 2